jgi:hypothetical protein
MRTIGGEWSTSRFRSFTSKERTSNNHWIEGCLCPEHNLYDMEKSVLLALQGPELRKLGRLACSRSLFLLSYTRILVYCNVYCCFTSSWRDHFCYDTTCHSKVGCVMYGKHLAKHSQGLQRVSVNNASEQSGYRLDTLIPFGKFSSKFFGKIQYFH